MTLLTSYRRAVNRRLLLCAVHSASVALCNNGIFDLATTAGLTHTHYIQSGPKIICCNNNNNHHNHIYIAPIRGCFRSAGEESIRRHKSKC